MSGQTIKTWLERMPEPKAAYQCDMNCSGVGLGKVLAESCGDCMPIKIYGDHTAARDEEIADLRAALSAAEQASARYRFLLSFLLDRNVLYRYPNGVWRLRGIYGVDDSGLKGAGRTPEEALDNAIIAVNLDQKAAEQFWTKSCEAILSAPAADASGQRAVASGATGLNDWHMICGDWKDELVAIHGKDGHIASGLTTEQARALIDAHSPGASTHRAAANSAGGQDGAA